MDPELIRKIIEELLLNQTPVSREMDEMELGNAASLLQKGFSVEETAQHVRLDPRVIQNVAFNLERGLSPQEIIQMETGGLEGRDRIAARGRSVDQPRETMDPNMSLAALLGVSPDQPQDVTNIDPTAELGDSALREFLNRVGVAGQQAVAPAVGMVQDLQRDPLSFTSVGDARSGIAAAQEGDIGKSALFALFAAAGLTGAGAGVSRARSAFKARARSAATHSVDEGGEAIGALQRELRERRSGESARRGADRPGPQGRRATDTESEGILRGAQQRAFRGIDQTAQARAAELRGSVTTDPIAELQRLLMSLDNLPK